LNCPENVIKLFVYNFELLNLDFREELLNYAMNDSTVYLVAFNMLSKFKSINTETRERYIKIFHNTLKNRDIWGGFILVYYNLIPKAISKAYLEESVEIEERLLYFFRFMMNHYVNLEEGFRHKLLRRISEYNSIFGKAIRNLFIKNLDIHGNLRKILKPTKINKKVKEMEGKITDRYESELIDILKLFEYNVLFYERLRKRFYPKELKCLILIEGLTPEEKFGTDYFYNPFSKKLDEFFKHLIPVIFPHIAKLETPEEREELLLNFAKRGFYLDDVFPMQIYNETRKSAMNLWIRKTIIPKIREEISKETLIIIIGEELYEILNKLLITEGYNNLNKIKIPNPINENSKLFKIRFEQVLKEFELK